MTAASTAGWRTMPPIPSTARTANQSIMTGPNTRPTRSVPRRWKENSRTRTTMVIGITARWRTGAATSKPSTADSTEIAGVIMPSP